MAELLLPIFLAPFIGSFLGVLIARLPAGRSVVWGGSACDGCGRPLRGIELVPLLSWVMLRGRCAGCGGAIGAFHPAVELAATAVAVWAVLAGGEPFQIWVNCLLGWWLLALAWIDALHMRLLDVLTLPLIVFGLVVTWWLFPGMLADHAIAAIVGYSAFRLLSIAYLKLRGQEGLGAGDAKLLAAGGAWVGVEFLSHTVMMAALLGIIGKSYIVWRRGKLELDVPLPFGPFLALAIWLIWIHFVASNIVWDLSFEL